MSDNPVTDAERDEIRAAVANMGLPGAVHAVERLSGGVSCDVFKVELEDETICVKRALPKLRVKADWRAPARRSSSEVAWLRLAKGILPEAVPDILGEDARRHLFAMQYFPAGENPVWKTLLARGHVEPSFAEAVGAAIARVHAATANNAKIASHFANDEQFLALRLDPFLLFCAAKHESVGLRLRTLANGVAKSRIALMHGDVSPKNILCGRNGPVFLDAETACYGDPAFDLAFCLTHILLKCVWHPERQEQYLECFANLTTGYAAEVVWEEPSRLASRAAMLVPALLLARVDGKSPAEYLDEKKRDFVRRRSIGFLKDSNAQLEDISKRWSLAIHRDL